MRGAHSHESCWPQLRRQISETWYQLTDEEVDSAREKIEHFKQVLQVKYGYAHDDVEHTLKRMIERVTGEAIWKA